MTLTCLVVVSLKLVQKVSKTNDGQFTVVENVLKCFNVRFCKRIRTYLCETFLLIFQTKCVVEEALSLAFPS